MTEKQARQDGEPMKMIFLITGFGDGKALNLA
jgi:hypothetical protein